MLLLHWDSSIVSYEWMTYQSLAFVFVNFIVKPLAKLHSDDISVNFLFFPFVLWISTQRGALRWQISEGKYVDFYSRIVSNEWMMAVPLQVFSTWTGTESSYYMNQSQWYPNMLYLQKECKLKLEYRMSVFPLIFVPNCLNTWK